MWGYAGGMRTVYADTLVLLNAAVDYLLLLSAGKLCGLPLRRGRLALGALWGGAYALCAALWPRCFSPVPLRLLAGAGMAVIGFGLGRQTPKAVAAVLASAAAFGGAVYALSSLSALPRAGAPSLRVLLSSFALCYALLSLLFRCAARRGRGRTAEVEIALAGRRVKLRALEDTGNELTDPVSGDAVLIAESAALAPLFPGEAALSETDAAAAMALWGARRPGRFRLLPCASVTAERALIVCFRPDEVRIGGRRASALIGISPHPLCGDGRYEAIWGGD